MSDAETLRTLLAEYGGWAYFREADPDAGPHAHGPGRKVPPGKYVQICRVCGAYRKDGHTPDCKIAVALRSGPQL